MSTKHFNPDEQLLPERSYRHVLWIPYALLILAILCLSCFQIYRISVGRVESAVPLNSKNAHKIKRTADSTIGTKSGEKTSNFPQVKALYDLSFTDPGKLGGTADRVTFRSQGGEVLCTIAKDLGKDQPRLLPLPYSPQAQRAGGPGVVCAGIYELKPGAEPLAKCPAGTGTRHISVIGVWGDTKSIGACLNGNTPMKDDAKGKTDNFQGERHKYKSLAVGQYTEFGDYACGFVGGGVQCVNVKSGAGFKYTDMFGYEFF